MVRADQVMRRDVYLSKAEEFINRDKRNLMDIYLFCLDAKESPSKRKLVKDIFEVHTLWINIINMESQPVEVQKLILQHYLRYSELMKEKKGDTGVEY